MSRSVQTDTEKKIAEIRERYGRRNESGQRFAIFQGHAAEDIDFLFSELDREREESRKLRERLKEELVWQDECLKLEEQLQSAQQDRDKLIEGLRVYLADLAERHHEAMQKWDREADMYEQGAACAYDIAESMLRDILKEIGVTLND